MNLCEAIKLSQPSIMETYYGIESNSHKPVLLEKMNTSALYKRHGKNGFIIVSANRSDEDKEVNEDRTRNLISDIQKEHFRYIPVYGGYRGKDGVEDDYESSFLVFPFDSVKKEKLDFLKLKNFAIKVCGKYNQDSVFVMEPDKAPNYLDRNGNVVNSSSSKNVKYNDLTQEFFTSFNNQETVNKEIDAKLKTMYRKQNAIGSFEDFKKKHLKDLDSVGRRFTSDIKFEWFANPYPCTLTERIRRQGKGEIVYEKNPDLV